MLTNPKRSASYAYQSQAICFLCLPIPGDLLLMLTNPRRSASYAYQSQAIYQLVRRFSTLQSHFTHPPFHHCAFLSSFAKPSFTSQVLAILYKTHQNILLLCTKHNKTLCCCAQNTIKHCAVVHKTHQNILLLCTKHTITFCCRAQNTIKHCAKHCAVVHKTQ